jgi:hypothetical protein
LTRFGENGSGNFATHPPTSQVFWPQTANDWCGAGFGAPCQTIDLSFLAGQPSVRIAFETVSYFGNPLLIDNVVISQFVGIDPGDKTPEAHIVYNAQQKRLHVSKSNNSSATLEILDLMGRLLATIQINGTNSSLPINLPSGVYLVRLGDINHFVSNKIAVR